MYVYPDKDAYTQSLLSDEKYNIHLTSVEEERRYVNDSTNVLSFMVWHLYICAL